MKIIKIGAIWCNGCLVMKPRWAQIEKENPWLETQYVDFDQDKETVNTYQVDSGILPVFIFLDNQGNEFLRLNGEIDKQQLVNFINQNKHL